MSRMIARVALFGLLVAGPVAVQAQEVTVTPDLSERAGMRTAPL